MASQQQRGMSKRTERILWILAGGTGLYFGARAAYKGVRRVLFGKDENPWRKALFYTAVAGTIIAHKYGDEIKESYHNFMNRAQEIVEVRDERSRDKLKNKLDEQYTIVKSLEDGNKIMEDVKRRLEEENTNLRNQTQNLEQKISLYQTDIRERQIRDEERSKYTSQTTSQPATRQQTHISANIKPEQEKKESLGLIERITSPFRRDNTTETRVIQRNEWYIVRPGETLSGIAQKYYGDINMYNELARHNNIRNPSDVAVGTPLRMLPGKQLRTDKNILSGDIPNYVTVRRGESLIDIVNRERLARPNDARKKAQEILEFNNQQLGYRLINMKESRIRESIVYIP